MPCKFHDAEIIICMDEEGNWGFGATVESAMENYSEEHTNGGCGFRLVKINVKIPVPVMIEVAIELTNDDTPPTIEVNRL